jgi:hypothetical protein
MNATQELVWETLLGANLTRQEYVGYSICAVSSPTVKALQGYNMVGLLFGADWCKPCLEFIPVLDRLYLVQAARGAHRLEIVLVSHCREAKATKYYGLGMQWLAMYHDADNKVGMNTRTTALMVKFGVTTIPALILLDERGQVICMEGRGWCVADPKGLAFPWWGKPTVGPVARAVISFDLPLAKRGQRPESLARILGANQPQSENLGAKQDPVTAVHPTGERERRVDRWAGHLIPPESARRTSALDMDPPPSFLSTCAEDTGPTTDVHRWANRMPQNSSGPFGAIALPPVRGIANVHDQASNRWMMRKREVVPPDKMTGPQPPPKPNFGMRIGPHGEMNTQPEG